MGLKITVCAPDEISGGIQVVLRVTPQNCAERAWGGAGNRCYGKSGLIAAL